VMRAEMKFDMKLLIGVRIRPEASSLFLPDSRTTPPEIGGPGDY
jgi:hypothetical protein